LRRYGRFIFPLIVVGLFLTPVIYSAVDSNLKEAKKNADLMATVQPLGKMVDLCKQAKPTVTGKFPTLSGPPRMVVLDLRYGTLHGWQDKLPDGQKAVREDQVDLLVCANRANEGHKVALDECRYASLEDGGSQRSVPRYRVDPQVVLIDPKTGQVVAAEVLQGIDPSDCPGVISAGENEIDGSLPDDQFKQWIGSVVGQARAEQTYGKQLAELCQNPAPVTGNVSPVGHLPRLLVLDLGATSLHVWHDQLPDERRPADASQVDYVVCVNREGDGISVQMGECVYPGMANPISRYRTDPRLVVVDPASGKSLKQDKLQGANPSDCPTDQAFGGGFEALLTSYMHSKQLPDFTVFSRWVDSNLKN
jgi:hypothetical protein